MTTTYKKVFAWNERRIQTISRDIKFSYFVLLYLKEQQYEIQTGFFFNFLK